MKYLLSVILLVMTNADASPVVWVVRHGQARQNRMRILNSDIALSDHYPLTELGQSHVKDAAQFIKDRIGRASVTLIASPLLRAQQSARIIALALEVPENHIATDHRLRENGMGRLEGQPVRYLEAFEQDWRHLGPRGYLHCAYELFGGENETSLRTRLNSLLEDIRLRPVDNVVLVTHGTPAEMLIEIVEPQSLVEIKLGGVYPLQLQAIKD